MAPIAEICQSSCAPFLSNTSHVISNVEDVINSTIANGQDDAFYVVDIENVINKHNNWLKRMPRVQPFYAIKCNTSPILLELLAALGTGFDCASKAEIDTVLDLNVSPKKIIYANPCKTTSFIKYAAKVGVNMMTFDNETELYKVAKSHPDAELVLRIKVDDSHSVCRFSAKFGADLDKVPLLLSTAKSLNLNIIGVSFHVGSNCEDPKQFADAIANAKYVYNRALEYGYRMRLIDLGGGYPGTSGDEQAFNTIANVISDALATHFPVQLTDEEQITIIAEPGRYYAASAFTLATMVIAKRLSPASNGQAKSAMYYLNDGVYGSFNCTLFDHYEVTPIPLQYYRHHETQKSLLAMENGELTKTTLWGPTCDSMDCVKRDTPLPELFVGDWVVFDDMGAYTIAAASNFNGFQLPTLRYLMNADTVDKLQQLRAWPRLAKLLDLSMNELSKVETNNNNSSDPRGLATLLKVH